MFVACEEFDKVNYTEAEDYMVFGLVQVIKDTATEDTFNFKAWRSLACFYSCPWFNRIWCVQGIVLACAAVFSTDTVAISWDRGRSAAAVLALQKTYHRYLAPKHGREDDLRRYASAA